MYWDRYLSWTFLILIALTSPISRNKSKAILDMWFFMLVIAIKFLYLNRIFIFFHSLLRVLANAEKIFCFLFESLLTYFPLVTYFTYKFIRKRLKYHLIIETVLLELNAFIKILFSSNFFTSEFNIEKCTDVQSINL